MADAAGSAATPASSTDTRSTTGTPVLNSDRQYATNPCSEFSFLNDTSCNLASLNLMKVRAGRRRVDVDGFVYASRA